MKRVLSFAVLLAVLVMATPSFACPMMDKMQTGLKAIAMSPVQVSDNLTAETKDAKFFPFAFIGGLLKGGFYMGKQIVTGALDIVTSPLAYIKK